MLLTITCTRPDDAAWAAGDLGYLLHKNPGRVQAFEQSYGTAHVMYPETDDRRCTAALLLEVDPVRLVRGKSRGTPEFSLGQYVNDRPYAASSLLAVTIAKVFGSALHGRCAQRPELAATALPLRIELPAVACKGGPETVRRMFAPLGWTVTATPLPLDPAFPDWGDSHYVRLELAGELRLADALTHLYVLLPVLDGSKHYWLDEAEIDKLLRFGEGWLASHPERAWITRRYLARRQSLVRVALARLAEVDDLEAEALGAVEEVGDDLADSGTTDSAGGREAPSETAPSTAESASAVDATTADDLASPSARYRSVIPACFWPGSAPGVAQPIAVDSGQKRAGTTGAGTVAVDGTGSRAVAATTAPTIAGAGADNAAAGGSMPSLAVTRRAAVIRALHEVGAHRVLDLGCGEGALLRELLADKAFTEIVGVDVAMRSLQIAKRRLARVPEWQARRVSLRQGALTYTDAALRGYDAAVLMEVIEHVDAPRLGALAHAVFGSAAPGAVVVTTPNSEYNALYETLPAGKFRHSDHRFEWSRCEFAAWARGICEKYGYEVRFEPIGVEDEALGASTQMAVFTKGTALVTNDGDEKGAA
ncbi:3' terminal RNA ribose 2'-O-methyltransferase Hen1 [Nocardia uniformis]|uniref:Small RNA 2'-O-methyltransferase n=1 Tax=Nocardia uniformis TaxID=53432 RepID=A0A849CD08_9NOCA|nr:3' terminal RNA ribose 2'-O-methyltransferase Hen1 [Nocardia uniformis]NNH74320.1 3' terminal RNA ribose 2'-O-methyltransferase Hen1 [Nocardia uniformis]